MWVPTGSTPTTVSWEIGTSAFLSDISSGFVVQVGFTFVNSNSDGFDVYNAHVDGLSGALVAGNTYYLTLGNGNDSFGNQLVAWDLNEGPATCFYAVGGVSRGRCGFGGRPSPSTVPALPAFPSPPAWSCSAPAFCCWADCCAASSANTLLQHSSEPGPRGSGFFCGQLPPA